MDPVRSLLCMMFARSAAVVSTFMLAVSVGCQKQPYPCVPVSGKVIYEDGSLISAERISVTFLSQTPSTDPRVHPRAGTAVVDCKTGSFASATTFVAKDGIIPGEHKVLIQCYVGRHMAHRPGGGRIRQFPDNPADNKYQPVAAGLESSQAQVSLRDLSVTGKPFPPRRCQASESCPPRHSPGNLPASLPRLRD